MRSALWFSVGLVVILCLPACRKGSGIDRTDRSSGSSARVAAEADVNRLICKVGGIERTFSRSVKVLVDAEDGLIVMGFGDANEAEALTIRVPKATAGRFTLDDTPKPSIHYSANMYSSNSSDQYRGCSEEDGTVVDVRVTEVRGPGKPVKGTFSGLVKSGQEGGDLKITEGVFSIIRGRPPKDPSRD